MKYVYKVLVPIFILIFSTSAYSLDERKLFGWGGTGGGNLTMFSKNHDNPVDQQGGLYFVYGGDASVPGDIVFVRYNGTNWAEKMSLDENGVFRIGVARTVSCGTGCKFAVDGKIAATEVKIAAATAWPDYVFSPEYELTPLDDVEEFIKKNNHLPGFQNASEIEASGYDLGEMNKKMLVKIEELTLHMIDLKKENDKLRQDLNVLLNSADSTR